MSSLLRLSGPALALSAILIVATVSLGRGIGPLYLLGVALVVLGVAGQLLQDRRQRPATDQEPIPVAMPVTGASAWSRTPKPFASIFARSSTELRWRGAMVPSPSALPWAA